ncbi:MAG TPA: SEC-C metal-binding domain-containing protein [Solirubrobacteraceae bacterium]|nr:SEC-C metal-binding domain-containing protein [Solirubrobacteraceae bacterium]
MATQPAPQNLDPTSLIEAAPEDEFALVELRLDWPYDLDIHPRHKQLWLRCFVLTQDPLSWIPDRDDAWTAVTVDDEVLEVDLYLTVDAVRRAMEDAGTSLDDAVGRYGATVMAAALEREEELLEGDYPRLAARGETPRLLADLEGDHGAFGTPTVQTKAAWSPIGLGALTDLVQHAFGAVDLDRTPVTLTTVEPVTDDCPACKGQSFGYPSSLEDAKATMCAPHQDAARSVNTARIARARASNFAGWRAVDKAVMRINKLPEPVFSPQPPRVVGETPARNDPCPCGSGKKYKKCHGA